MVDSTHLVPWVMGAALCLGGCYSGLDVGADADSSGDDDPVNDPEAQCEEANAGSLPRMVRLTHSQYDNTVRDLLGLDLDSSSVFLPDPLVGGFSNNAESLTVTDRLARDYRRAAEEIAEALGEQPEVLSALIPCDAGAGQACADQFIASFGRRAYRRPLTVDEQAAFAAIFAAGDGLYNSGSAFDQGIQLVVEAFLQSPHFLYRVELSSTVDAEDPTIVPLSGYEIASRLSFLMWNSMPDDELLDAAAAGELDTAQGVEQAARRLLADARATGPVRDFHYQWLRLEEYETINKNAEVFPQYQPGMSHVMEEETLRFIERVMLEQDGTWTDLMTTPGTFVNAETAGLYGLDGSNYGEELTWVDLPATERKGILTQSGFLATNAYADITSPIHRGVFVQRNILCAAIPEPPGNVDPTLPDFEGEIRTTRDAVEVHTSPVSCGGCHDSINAPGFLFEGYDAMGQVRATENGVPVDTASTVVVGAEEHQFAGAMDFIDHVAESEVARRCYLTQWFRYANMRQETFDDQCTLDGLHQVLQDTDYNLRELLVAMTQTTTFRFRASEAG
ncbi:MAG: DUF1592 domain-containing protein [Deltaproteobacteria bacterium]|nr:DUF1592 domain-containing protein [Deltaproteobacteria bacterium]